MIDFFNKPVRIIGSEQSLISSEVKIIKDLYMVYQHQLESLHEEILTVVIIVLIAVETVFAFLHK